jgi:hypothetical protein
MDLAIGRGLVERRKEIGFGLGWAVHRLNRQSLPDPAALKRPRRHAQ